MADPNISTSQERLKGVIREDSEYSEFNESKRYLDTDDSFIAILEENPDRSGAETPKMPDQAFFDADAGSQETFPKRQLDLSTSISRSRDVLSDGGSQRVFPNPQSQLYLDTTYTETGEIESTEHYCKLDDKFDFERMEELNRGGFGVIYRVVDRLTNKEYAQKVLEVGQLKESTAKRQFAREAKVLFMCPHHPHIIKMVHTAEDPVNQEYMITLELAPCGSVKDYFGGKIPLEEPKVQKYVKQILLGLNHMHEQKIVYRDLKLSNMLLITEDHLKLADFGISKVFEADVDETQDFQHQLQELSRVRSESIRAKHRSVSQSQEEELQGQDPVSPDTPDKRLTREVRQNNSLHTLDSIEEDKYRAKDLVGTKYYQPPEMLARSGHSFKMDIWSLGIIIWQMLFGGMPFLLRDKKQVKRIMKRGIRFPHTPEVSEECEDFITKCLQLEKDRMDSTEALEHPWMTNVELPEFQF